ncbi:MAG: glycosyltransferase [Candidatus Aminicenantes bacterium]|nr:glycosyltransferase [Candidatus Aminicenantes bacterium]
MINAKVALVHDWLTGQRGGEKVLEVFSEIFPRAPIYTLFYFPGSQSEILEQKDIRTSFLQRMPFLKRRYRFYLPLFPLAAEMFDLQEYDLVLSSSHCVAKGIIPRPDALHISYIHSPIRYAWNQYFPYFSPKKLGLFSKFLIPPVIHYLRLWDESSSHRVDHFVANSHNVARRIEKYYRRSAEVIHPPVDTVFFQPGELKKDYFLIVSALVPYKRIDLAVAAFSKSGCPLYIVGDGPDYKKLKSQAKSNVRFLGSVDAETLKRTYQEAQALLMPGEEDFGINALESQACGTPVIAYERGGALETILPGKTGLFFRKQRIQYLLDVLDKFQSMQFNRAFIRENALKFSRNTFKESMCRYLEKKTEAAQG